MKLSEIKYILENNLEDLEHSFIDPKGSNSIAYTIKNLTNFRKAINNIEVTNTFEKAISGIKKSLIFSNPYDEMNLNPREYNTLDIITQRIIDTGYTLINAIDNIIPKESENIINIKLAPTTSNFFDLIKDLETLEKALSQIVFYPGVEGKLEIEAFEPGSKWIKILVGSLFSVQIIGIAAWSGAVVSKKIKEGEELEQLIRTRQMENDYVEQLIKANDVYVKNLIEAEAKQIQNSEFKEDDPERLERIKLTIKLFSELINKGTEIHPALNAPEKVDNLFPKNLPVNLIEWKAKRLEQNNVQENGQE